MHHSYIRFSLKLRNIDHITAFYTTHTHALMHIYKNNIIIWLHWQMSCYNCFLFHSIWLLLLIKYESRDMTKTSSAQTLCRWIMCVLFGMEGATRKTPERTMSVLNYIFQLIHMANILTTYTHNPTHTHRKRGKQKDIQQNVGHDDDDKQRNAMQRSVVKFIERAASNNFSRHPKHWHSFHIFLSKLCSVGLRCLFVQNGIEAKHW